MALVRVQPLARLVQVRRPVPLRRRRRGGARATGEKMDRRAITCCWWARAGEHLGAVSWPNPAGCGPAPSTASGPDLALKVTIVRALNARLALHMTQQQHGEQVIERLCGTISSWQPRASSLIELTRALGDQRQVSE